MVQGALLLVLLAFLKVDLWLPSLADVLPNLPATLSLNPQHPVYIFGEHLTLSCSVPEGLRVAGYKFYKEPQDRIFKQMGPHKVIRVDPYTVGNYSCVYRMVLASGQKFESSRSNLVSVAMTNRTRPLPPVFSVSPKQDVYRRGESVNLTCSVAPEDRLVLTRILFRKDEQQLHLLQPSSSLNTSTYSLRLVPQDSGRYSCSYEVAESGREIPSLESNFISLSMMAFPTTMIPEFSSSAQAAHSNRVTTLGKPILSECDAAWLWELAVVGSFFAINSLIFLVTIGHL